MPDDILRLIVTGGSGGLAGALFTAWGTGVWRRWRLHSKLKVERAILHRPVLSVSVRNGHVFPITGCAGYLTLDYSLDSIIKPRLDRGIPDGASITENNRHPLKEGRLCWSAGWGKAVETVDIYPGESKSLEILEFAGDDTVGIFSETRDKPYRVWLLGREYHGTLKIVCKETKAKEFPVYLQQGAYSESIKKDAKFPKNFLTG